MTGPGETGNCCTFQKSKSDDRILHRSGLCIIHLGSLYRNCPNLQTFDGIEIGKFSQERLSFPKWNAKVKKLFYEEYLKAGGNKELKSWSSSRWFSKKPVRSRQLRHLAPVLAHHSLHGSVGKLECLVNSHNGI